MTFERAPEVEAEDAVRSAVFDGLTRDPRFAADVGDEVVSLKHISSGRRWLLEWRLLPLGEEDGDG